MQTTLLSPISKPRQWTGRVFSGLFALFMFFDAAIHLTTPAPVVDAFTHLGFPLKTSIGIGVAELVCTIVYLIPGTAVLGAVLLTGVLGGAVAAHIRVPDPIFDTYIFPAIMGALLWGGLILRDGRIGTLLFERR